MEEIQVFGGIPLQGETRIQGSKNAALPILAAALMTDGTSVLANCPRISDVHKTLELLALLGCQIRWTDYGLLIDTSRLCPMELPEGKIGELRSSICLLGALLTRCDEVTIEYPGGCVIGSRPIDLHLFGLKQLGVTFEEEQGRLWARRGRRLSHIITLPIPSVGATENIVLLATRTSGETILRNAAREPEIVALCRYLVMCGACIEGIGTDELQIQGVDCLKGVRFMIPADRIVAGTYLLAAIATRGQVFLRQAPREHMTGVLELAGQMGAEVDASEEGVYVCCKEDFVNQSLDTAYYPGFPTDLQSIYLAASLLGEGSCVVRETIFENRFRIVKELQKMGGSLIQLSPTEVLVEGKSTLKGCRLEAKELRGGAALVVAALCARGKSSIAPVDFIQRGYENIVRDFKDLGARIVSVQT